MILWLLNCYYFTASVVIILIVCFIRLILICLILMSLNNACFVITEQELLNVIIICLDNFDFYCSPLASIIDPRFAVCVILPLHCHFIWGFNKSCGAPLICYYRFYNTPAFSTDLVGIPIGSIVLFYSARVALSRVLSSFVACIIIVLRIFLFICLSCVTNLAPNVGPRSCFVCCLWPL